MKISDVQIYRYTLPLKAPIHLKYETLTERKGFLLRLVSDTGACGWGEAAPLPGFSKESFGAVGEELIRCAEKLYAYRLPDAYAELEGTGLVSGLNVSNVSSVVQKTVSKVMSAKNGIIWHEDDMSFNSTSFAIESAYYNLMAAHNGLPLHRYLNPNAPETLHINALLSGSDEEVMAKAATLNPQNAKAAKLKVGTLDLADDIKRVRQVRQALDSKVTLRLDANRAWSLADALNVAEELQEWNIEYIEEPLSQPAQLREFAQHSFIPYALDETLSDFHKLVEIPENEYHTDIFQDSTQNLREIFVGAYACVWKPTIMHMSHMGEDILRGTFGLPINRLVLSAAYESGVGIANLAAYAAAFSKPEIPAGLDTYSWLAEDVLEKPLPFVNGSINLSAAHAAAQRVNTDKLQLHWAD